MPDIPASSDARAPESAIELLASTDTVQTIGMALDTINKFGVQIQAVSSITLSSHAGCC